VLVIAHPNPASLTATAAKTYEEAVRRLGHDCVTRDLYRERFDPCLRAEEIPKPEGWRPGEDVVQERLVISDADVIAFFYPLWFNSPPAILKGYVDRVFGMGFGFTPLPAEPLLETKSLISFTFSGAPEHWVVETGALQALMALFDRHLSQMTGLRLLDHVHSGGVAADTRPDAVDDILLRVRQAVETHFAPPAADEA
jgi:NAD(P)H dehydrogenase (quinone)